jgi:antitoxin HicB
MPSYVAIVHKDQDSCYGVQFPDLPGTTTAGDTIDEAVANAAEVLAFVAEDWQELHGRPLPVPRTIDQLRGDPKFTEAAEDGLLLIVPLDLPADRVAAE